MLRCHARRIPDGCGETPVLRIMSLSDDNTPEPNKTEPVPEKKPSGPEWRQKLLKAKAAGADDQTAAEFAEISPEEFEQHLVDDPTLEREMLGARAKALLDHLNSIAAAKQWQAHEFMLEKLWPNLFRKAAAGTPDSPTLVALREVGNKMTADQVERIPELLQVGVDFDNQTRSGPCKRREDVKS